jgi:CheY-like chemotaxis protein
MNDPLKLNVVLMAEDDSDDRLLVRDALSECTWQADLRFVANGEELLDYLFRRGAYEGSDAPRPGLILLDLNMPRKDGREVLREIKQHSDLRRIPVVVLTTSHAEEDVVRAYNLQANCYVTKPVDFLQFTRIVQTIEDFWLTVVTLPPRESI